MAEGEESAHGVAGDAVREVVRGGDVGFYQLVDQVEVSDVAACAGAASVAELVGDDAGDAAFGEGVEDIEVALAVVALAVVEDAGCAFWGVRVWPHDGAVHEVALDVDVFVFDVHLARSRDM